MTTGHEWNGIKELNTPVPRSVLFFLAAGFAVRRRLLAADAGLAAGLDLHQGPARHRPARGGDASRSRTPRPSAPSGPTAIAAASFAEIEADPALMRDVREDRAHAVRRQLRRLPRHRRAPADRAFPTSPPRPGCGAASPRRSPRRSASASTRPTTKRASRRCWPSAGTGSSTASRSRTSSAYVMSLVRPAAPQADAERGQGRAGGLRGQLRRLPWRGRQGQPGASARPT